jgi:hypothetical protein
MELMEGLTLLSTEVRGEFAWVLYFCLVLCIFCIVPVIVFAIDSIQCNEYGMLFLFTFLAIIFCVLGFICIDHANEPPTTVYKVTIDESVSMVEFYERYEILDQEGLIFTITEKEK